MTSSQEKALERAEDWFVAQGLPYFVDHLRRDARSGLSRRIFMPMVGVALALGAVAGVASGTWAEDVSLGLLVGFVLTVLLLAAYGVLRLHLGPIARWAGARTFSSLGLLLPLVTRALPLLLLFITFLFINTEVWQVASTLDGGVLWIAVLLFAAVATAFLLVKLPEELDVVDDEIGGARLVSSCRGTPLEAQAEAFEHEDVSGIAQVRGYAKGNLVLVLLVSQMLQVLLLSVAVYVFFVVFGCVAIRGSVIEAWTGSSPHWILPGVHLVSLELLQVSVFLAAFSGLYFTVYAVSEETYRKQFFASLMDELERSVGVRAVYRSLKVEPADAAE